MATSEIDEQAQFLSEALNNVKNEGFQMKRCFDNAQLMEGLRHASAMLSELRTSLLSPKNYYELYMAVSDELRHLEAFLLDEFEKGRKVSDLYELVQYVANIVPRLYLLVTVGAVYVKAKQVPTRDIMRDLVEMCRGVQHPLRGLFVRNYLLSSIKGQLPTDRESDDGTLFDSIDFILLNFAEMNKLWVRMQHQGHTRERKRREQERLQLRLLVGTNLVRLSSLEGVDLEVYSTKILPAVLEQVVSCRDPIAQEYLMECIIQVFPDEFHLRTLDVFLQGCGRLQPRVNVKLVIQAIMDRLAAYATQDDGSLPSDIQLFDVFSKQIADVVNARPEMPFEDVVALQVSLTKLAINCYPDQIDLVDQALHYTQAQIKARNLQNIDEDSPVCAELVRLIKVPFESYERPTVALKLNNLSGLFKSLAFTPRHDLATAAARTMVEKDASFVSLDEVNVLFEMLETLVKDQDDQPSDFLDEEDFVAEQELVASVVGLVVGESRDVQFQMLSTLKKTLLEGGKRRIQHTLPSVCFKAFALARAYYAGRDEDELWEKKVGKIYQLCHQTITSLSKDDYHELAIRLFLQAAAAADATPFDRAETIAYEFMSQAFLIYEEEISDSKLQIALILVMISSLEKMSVFGEENFTPLATKCAVVSSKLIKKPDQCRGVLAASHLFWTGKTSEGGERRDGKQVLQCLQRALKVARGCMEEVVQAALYVESLDNFILFFNKGCEAVTSDHINKIGTLISDTLQGLPSGEDADAVREHFARSQAWVAARKKVSVGPSFSDIDV